MPRCHLTGEQNYRHCSVVFLYTVTLHSTTENDLGFFKKCLIGRHCLIGVYLGAGFHYTYICTRVSVWECGNVWKCARERPIVSSQRFLYTSRVLSFALFYLLFELTPSLLASCLRWTRSLARSLCRSLPRSSMKPFSFDGWPFVDPAFDCPHD